MSAILPSLLSGAIDMKRLSLGLQVHDRPLSNSGRRLIIYQKSSVLEPPNSGQLRLSDSIRVRRSRHLHEETEGEDAPQREHHLLGRHQAVRLQRLAARLACPDVGLRTMTNSHQLPDYDRVRSVCTSDERGQGSQ